MTFDIFMTERGVLRWSRRPNADLIRPDLRGNKRPVFRATLCG
jgi:hypothetical protein